MTTNSLEIFIGLDVGERRIGVASINSIAKIAEPLELIVATKQDVLQDIKNVIESIQAKGVVVGLPRGLDGQETEQTGYCRDFAENLQADIEVPVYLIDEAGSSKEADQRIKDQNSSASRDSMAAAVFLEDFIKQKDKDSLRVV